MPQISLADLSRVHRQADEPSAAPAARLAATASPARSISDCRRVAFADETAGGLALLQAWAAQNCSRPDDLEFLLLARSVTSPPCDLVPLPIGIAAESSLPARLLW